MISRETGEELNQETHVTYLPLINMNPADPGTVLTTMHLVKCETEKEGQNCTMFTNDQQFSKLIHTDNVVESFRVEDFLSRSWSNAYVNVICRVHWLFNGEHRIIKLAQGCAGRG